MRYQYLYKLFETITGYRIAINRINTSFPNLDFEKLRVNYPSISPLLLHFGCGPRVLKNWVNIDLVYEPFEKYLKYYGDEFYSREIRGTKDDFYSIDITRMGLPLPDNSVDLIFHEDFLEHLSQKEQILFLSETYRVLKPGAIHRINTPNLITSMKKNSKFKSGKEGVYADEWDKYGHISVLTKKSLNEIAELIGYSKCIYTTKNGSSSKLLPKEYRPAGDRDDIEGNIYADLIK